MCLPCMIGACSDICLCHNLHFPWSQNNFMQCNPHVIFLNFRFSFLVSSFCDHNAQCTKPMKHWNRICKWEAIETRNFETEYDISHFSLHYFRICRIYIYWNYAFFHVEYKNDCAYAVFICPSKCMYMESRDHKNYCRKKRNEYAVYETVFYWSVLLLIKFATSSSKKI